MNPRIIYKIVSETEWRDAEQKGRFDGSDVDRKDGFIHFSTAAQVRETASKHFARVGGLLLVALDAGALDLKWEPSRGGALFPHLYAPLPLSAVKSVASLPLGENGEHRFPPLEAEPA